MNDDKRAAKDKALSSDSARVYEAPKLREFGHVSELTQAGTGLQTENMAGQGPTSKRP